MPFRPCRLCNFYCVLWSLRFPVWVRIRQAQVPESLQCRSEYSHYHAWDMTQKKYWSEKMQTELPAYKRCILFWNASVPSDRICVFFSSCVPFRASYVLFVSLFHLRFLVDSLTCRLLTAAQITNIIYPATPPIVFRSRSSTSKLPTFVNNWNVSTHRLSVKL